MHILRGRLTGQVFFKLLVLFTCICREPMALVASVQGHNQIRLYFDGNQVRIPGATSEETELLGHIFCLYDIHYQFEEACFSNQKVISDGKKVSLAAIRKILIEEGRVNSGTYLPPKDANFAAKNLLPPENLAFIFPLMLQNLWYSGLALFAKGYDLPEVLFSVAIRTGLIGHYLGLNKEINAWFDRGDRTFNDVVLYPFYRFVLKVSFYLALVQPELALLPGFFLSVFANNLFVSFYQKAEDLMLEGLEFSGASKKLPDLKSLPLIRRAKKMDNFEVYRSIIIRAFIRPAIGFGHLFFVSDHIALYAATVGLAYLASKGALRFRSKALLRGQKNREKTLRKKLILAHDNLQNQADKHNPAYAGVLKSLHALSQEMGRDAQAK